jgi:hypothetical protein
MCQRSMKSVSSAPPSCGCAASTGAAVIQRSHNYDNVTGRRLNPAGGHYMIPPSEFAAVVARASFDPRVLNCYQFVPLPPPTPPCLPTPMRPHRR